MQNQGNGWSSKSGAPIAFVTDPSPDGRVVSAAVSLHLWSKLIVDYYSTAPYSSRESSSDPALL
jgi:hypothetical protein